MVIILAWVFWDYQHSQVIMLMLAGGPKTLGGYFFCSEWALIAVCAFELSFLLFIFFSASSVVQVVLEIMVGASQSEFPLICGHDPPDSVS